MDNLSNSLISKRNIFVFLFLAIIAVAIPVSLKLAQTQTQLKSQAADVALTGSIGVASVATKGTNGTYAPVYITVIANTGWKLFIYNGTCNPCSTTSGWTPLDQLGGKSSGSGNDTVTWGVPQNLEGTYTIALFNSNATGIAAQKNITLRASDTTSTDCNVTPQDVSSWPNCTNEQLLVKLPGNNLGLLPNQRLETFGNATLLERLTFDRLAGSNGLTEVRLKEFENNDLIKIGQGLGNLVTFLSRFSNDRLVNFDTSILKQLPLERQKTFGCDIQILLGLTCGGSGAIGLKTQCYILSEDTGAVNAATSCSHSLARPFTSSPITISGFFSAAGMKTYSVKFINTAGVSSPVSSKSITYNPAGSNNGITQTIINVSCQQNLVTVTGTNLGNQQGTGRITVNSQPATVTRWSDTTVIATPAQLLSGDNIVQVTLGNGQSPSSYQCAVNTTTVAFTAVNSCRRPGDFAAENVSAKIYDVTSTDATPLIEQTISLDKNGKPINFAPKLTQGKQYTLIVKAPNTVARAKVFTPTGGTFNLPVIILPAGDIFPVVAPDGFINQLDLSELKRQWAIGTDVSRLADLNNDSRVNSLDYSCGINNNTLKDDLFSAATLPTATSTPTASPTTNPAAEDNPSAPNIISITPPNGLISSVVTITGVNFGDSNGTVKFYSGGASTPTASAGINFWSNTQIKIIVPGGLSPSTSYNIQVETANGVKSSKAPYFVGP